MSKQTLSEQFWQGLGDAITDIRQKVVEEPMYGRTVTDGADAPHWPEAQEQEPSFGSSTHTREIAPSQDIELDR
jgi:hypothetical protein